MREIQRLQAFFLFAQHNFEKSLEIYTKIDAGVYLYLEYPEQYMYNLYITGPFLSWGKDGPTPEQLNSFVVKLQECLYHVLQIIWVKKNFAVVELKCNSLENIHGRMVILCGHTILHGGIIAISMEKCVVTDQTARAMELFH